MVIISQSKIITVHILCHYMMDLKASMTLFYVKI